MKDCIFGGWLFKRLCKAKKTSDTNKSSHYATRECKAQRNELGALLSQINMALEYLKLETRSRLTDRERCHNLEEV